MGHGVKPENDKAIISGSTDVQIMAYMLIRGKPLKPEPTKCTCSFVDSILTTAFSVLKYYLNLRQYYPNAHVDFSIYYLI